MEHASYVSTDYRTDIPFRGNGQTYEEPPEGWRGMGELRAIGVYVNCLLANGAIVKGWAARTGGRHAFWTFNTKPGAGHARIAPVGWKPLG